MPNRQYFPRPLVIKGDSAGSQAQNFTLTGLLTLQAGLTVSGGSISASGIAATVGTVTATELRANTAVEANIQTWQTDATADNGRWELQAVTEGLALRTLNDARTSAATVFRVERTGITVDSVSFGSVPVSVGVLTATEVRASSDVGGAASTNSLTNISDTAARSTGVGTILFDDVTNRNSAGFIKFYVGVTAYYVPIFAAI